MNFKRSLFAIYLLLLSVTVNSQSTLKSIYDIENNFPPEMKKAKTFINAICSDYLIYDFKFGNNNSYQSNYQFKLKSVTDLKLTLPYTDNFSISFLDFKTKQPLKEHTLYVDYSFNYLKYNPEFNLNKTTFSALSYFKLGIEINQYSENELTKQILTNLITDSPFDKRYEIFLKKISSKYKLQSVSITELFSEDDELSTDEKIEKINQSLTDQIDEELNIVLFNTFLLNKTDEKKSFEILKKIFPGDIIQSIDNVLEQKILINTNKSAFLKIPNKYIAFFNEDQSFPVNLIEAKLDFKNKKLLILLKNDTPIKLALKNTKAVNNPKVLNEVNVTTNSLQLVISESETKLLIPDNYSNNNYEIMLL